MFILFLYNNIPSPMIIVKKIDYISFDIDWVLYMSNKPWYVWNSKEVNLFLIIMLIIKKNFKVENKLLIKIDIKLLKKIDTKLLIKMDIKMLIKMDIKMMIEMKIKLII